MAAKSSAAVALPAITSNRPLAAVMLEWEKSAKPLLQPEQRALIDGQTPLCLLQYEPASLPAALVVNATEGTTAQHVQARELERLRTTDKNKMLKQQRATHESEIKLAIFSSLEACMKAAPLLLEDLKKRCKQEAPFDSWHDGVKAWAILHGMSDTSKQRPGEASEHDAALLAMQLKPLEDGCTADEYSARVTDATQ